VNNEIESLSSAPTRRCDPGPTTVFRNNSGGRSADELYRASPVEHQRTTGSHPSYRHEESACGWRFVDRWGQRAADRLRHAALRDCAAASCWRDSIRRASTGGGVPRRRLAARPGAVATSSSAYRLPRAGAPLAPSARVPSRGSRRAPRRRAPRPTSSFSQRRRRKALPEMTPLLESSRSAAFAEMAGSV
jgi:hypothetical protein